MSKLLVARLVILVCLLILAFVVGVQPVPACPLCSECQSNYASCYSGCDEDPQCIHDCISSLYDCQMGCCTYGGDCGCPAGCPCSCCYEPNLGFTYCC